MVHQIVVNRRTLLRGGAGALATAAAAVRPAVVVAQDEEVNPDELGALTLVIGGLDSRRPGEPENADVFMLARVDVPNRTVRAVSVPRDLYLEIPGFGYDKVTRAYDFGSKADGESFQGGAATMRATVEANFGLEVDGVVVTTFGGFVEIVDALGGIDVDNPYDLYDGEYPTVDYGYKEIFYPAGPNHLSGEQALEFARTRHQDGDDGRVMRQQLVIRALLERARDGALADQLPDLVKKHRKAVRTDLDSDTRIALAVLAPSFANENVTFTTLNAFIYPDSAPNGMWIYSGDWSGIPGYVQGFLDGVESR